jgi:hypothetical protein
MYVLETCFTSHKNICKIVNQKIAQKIHYIHNTTISFYDSMYVHRLYIYAHMYVV